MGNGIKHLNIVHLGCFKPSGIRAGFMTVSDKNGIKIFVSPLQHFQFKIKSAFGNSNTKLNVKHLEQKFGSNIKRIKKVHSLIIK